MGGSPGHRVGGPVTEAETVFRTFDAAGVADMILQVETMVVLPRN
jgi:hypothetical protein